MGKKIVKASKDASWARLPRMDAITVLQVQLFDNREKSEGIKGRSDYALKLFAWTAGYNIDLQKPDWWRVVQLIEPKSVLAWARKKHDAGEMTADQYATYRVVAESAMEAERSGQYAIVKMGHIASPPGTQYFVGQFVYIQQTYSGEVEGVLVNGDEPYALDDFKITRKRGRIRKPGTPTHAMLADWMNILERQRLETEALAARRAERSHSNTRIDPSFDDFLGGSPL